MEVISTGRKPLLDRGYALALDGAVAQFRRPVFAVLQEVFHQSLLLAETPRPAWAESVDEVLLFAALLPLAYTNLKAQCRKYVSCTDASEKGGAAAEAKHFVNALDQPAGAVVDDVLASVLEEGSHAKASNLSEAYACGACGLMPSHLSILCPRRCGAACCDVACVVKHSEDLCHLKEWSVPRFIELCPNTDSVFTEAVARELILVGPAWDDSQLRPSLMCPDGMSFVSWWCDDPSTVAEHYRPPAT